MVGATLANTLTNTLGQPCLVGGCSLANGSANDRSNVGPTFCQPVCQPFKTQTDANLLPAVANHCQRWPNVAPTRCAVWDTLPAHPATYPGLTLGVLRGFDLESTWLEAPIPLPANSFEGSALGISKGY